MATPSCIVTAKPISTFGLCRSAAKLLPRSIPKVIGCSGIAPRRGAGVQVWLLTHSPSICDPIVPHRSGRAVAALNGIRGLLARLKWLPPWGMR